MALPMNVDQKIRLKERIVGGLRAEISQLEKEHADLENQTQNLQDKLHSSDATFSKLSACGVMIPVDSYTRSFLEEGKSKSTATFHTDESSFTLSVSTNDKQEILELEIDVANAPKLWEIEKHLKDLQEFKDPQRIIFDIIAFVEIDKFRQRILSVLQSSAKSFTVVLPKAEHNCDMSPVIKAVNPATSEVYFELKWCVRFSDEHLTLYHDFLFKCIPLVKQGNECISTMVSSLHKTLYWMENQPSLDELWMKIFNWVKNSAPL